MIDFLSKKLLPAVIFTFLSAFSLSAQEICDNLIDDDNDGLIDLLDDDCNCFLDDNFEYIPNGSFEGKTGCCSMLNDVNNCLDDWIILQGTPDLYDPDCMSETDLQNTEDLYGIDITSTIVNFGVAGSFSETFGTCTNAPLFAGQLYVFSADYAQIDIFFPEMPVVAELSIYGFQDCSQLENWNYTDDPCAASPGLVELASFFTTTLDVASWQELNLGFIPTVDIEALVIMVNCNNQNSNNQGIFISMDNLSIVSESSYDYQDSITVDGDVCDFSFFLEVTDSTAFTYQWYFEGEPIIGEMGPSLELNGQDPFIPGIYNVTILEDNGCSSSAEYTLIIPTLDQEEFYSICPGDSVFVVGKYWDEPGDYVINYLDTISPCQIKLDFHIDLYDTFEIPEETTICQGESYDFRGQLVTMQGLYYDSLQTINGCDSVFILDLIVQTSTEDIQEVSICTGDSYIFEGTEYEVGGTYQEDYFNQFGCDSTMILILTVENIIVSDTIDILINDDEKYFFNGDSLDVEGIYSDTLTSGGGCDSIFSINLAIETSCVLDALISSNNISCFGMEDGTITVEVIGSNENYNYSIDGGLTFFASNIFDNLPAGNYEIIVIDEIDCVVNIGMTVIAGAQALTGTVTEDQTINEGETATIEILQSSFDPSIYLWTSIGDIDCDDCSQITVSPTATTEYFVTIIDENGCEITLSTTVFVRANTDIYIPNIFSPNNDGINEVFKIYSSTDKNRGIIIFAVYDRWGNKIYEEKDTDIASMVGWNGRMNSSSVAQGVYAFYAILSDVTDKQEVIKGNVTVLR